MEEYASLCMVTVNGLIKIPFLGLQELDAFTARYNNKIELVNGFNELLKLSILPEQVDRVYVYYEYQVGKNDEKFKDSYIPVKYRGDNFNVDSLKQTFTQYLINNHDKIKECGVRKINTSAMREFMLGYDNLSDFDIKTAVDWYFGDNKYAKIRNAYFMVKGKTKLSKDKILIEQPKTIERSLSRFSSNDENFQHLLEYASRGEEESYRVMEELSKFDLEELQIMLKNQHFGLFDGMIKNTDVSLDEVNGLTQSKSDNFLYDLYDLEKYTGYDIDELIEYVSRKGYGR